MEPNEALGIAAQVAATLVGFAGIIVVFRPKSVHEWSEVDRLRLFLLLVNSIMPLLLSLVGMLLLTVKPEPEWIWRGCSGVALVCQGFGMIGGGRNIGRLAAPGLKGASRLLFVGVSALAMTSVVLQFVNAFSWNIFWPFFLAIVSQLVTAVLQFARFVVVSHTD